MDPSMLISRLRAEIEMLKAEIAILKGDNGGSGELAEYEKDRYCIIQFRVKTAVDIYLEDISPDCKLVLADFRKIQYAFELMKSSIKNPTTIHETNPRETNEILDIDSRNLTEEQIKRFAKLKHLVTHRDNEINILVEMISKMKASMQEEQAAVKDSRLNLVIEINNNSFPNPFLLIAYLLQLYLLRMKYQISSRMLIHATTHYLTELKSLNFLAIKQGRLKYLSEGILPVNGLITKKKS